MPLDMVAEASEGMADDEVRRPRKHQTLYHAVAGER